MKASIFIGGDVCFSTPLLIRYTIFRFKNVLEISLRVCKGRSRQVFYFRRKLRNSEKMLSSSSATSAAPSIRSTCLGARFFFLKFSLFVVAEVDLKCE